MKLIEVDAEQTSSGPTLRIQSGRLNVEASLLRPRMSRWHWWNDGRYSGLVLGRTLMTPVFSIRVEWWGR